MWDERKKPGWMWSTTINLLVLLIYVVNIGPYWWFFSRGNVPLPVQWVMGAIYTPFDMIGRIDWIARAIWKYIDLWCP